jgi:hypothetical protein
VAFWRGHAVTPLGFRAAFDNWATTDRDVALLEEAVVEIGDRQSRKRSTA